MEYQTLYRKYRPNSFGLVFGQDVIVRTLQNVIKNNKLSHAYLFTGPRGTGKTSCAKLFAKAVNCLNNNDGDACNQCESCISFNNNSNPDIIEIDAASNNGVDDIRELKSKINVVPSSSKYKIYIIDEVHMLSQGAFNALLKTLEEPPKYVIFILATTEPQKVPVTVLSRCQRFDFKSISKEKMHDCLLNIIKKENIVIEEPAINEIISNSKGGMRDAIGMLDQAFAYSEGTITLNDVEELSGNISKDEMIDTFKNIFDSNYKEISQKVQKWSDCGKDFSLILQKMLLFLKTGILYKKNILTNNDKINELTFFDKINENKIYVLTDLLTDLIKKLDNSYEKEITFEINLISIIDSLNTDVPRETSVVEKTQLNKINIPHETLKEDIINNKSNVPRGTLEKSEDIIEKLKTIRINNIIMNSTKRDLKYVKDIWNKLNDLLIDNKYKIVAGILLEGKPIVAANNGIIVALSSNTSLKRIEKNYDLSKEVLEKLLNSKHKMVYITEETWERIRPDYVKKVKEKTIIEINEAEILKQVKNKIKKNSVTEFNDLIEMEEK